MMNPEPQKEHVWLQKLVGDWTYESESQMGPDQPLAKCGGSERVRPLGALWVLAEGQGEMPGGGLAKTVMTIGYDPGRGCFVGTWIGSMMTHLWHYEGYLDAGERLLTLETEGPDMSGAGTTCKYRDIIEILSDDQRTLTSQVLGQDGIWQQIMTARFRRAPVAG